MEFLEIGGGAPEKHKSACYVKKGSRNFLPTAVPYEYGYQLGMDPQVRNCK